ncbi:hypothetical protein [uncultured Victivallis sp.]|uniref:hypothetical protein n=1 Tax=uncultured Victivallis sp. TaxID=354118 RepID=UPI0025F79278|nr:hypothetical protein [uncultured Victivallis sp.]
MKQLILALILAGSSLWAGEKILDVNGTFKENAVGWRALSKNGVLSVLPDGGVELKRSEANSPYADAFYMRPFEINSGDTLTIVVTARGSGRLCFGLSIEGIGNYYSGQNLEADFKEYKYTYQFEKYAQKLPAKAYLKFVLEKGENVVVKTVSAQITSKK